MAIRTAESAVSANTDDANTIRALHAWISSYLTSRPIPDLRKIAEWQAWATRKLATGWDANAIRQHIADAWERHASGYGNDASPW